MSDGLLCWVDIETTGLDPTTDFLLEVALVVTDNHGRIVDNMSKLIRPGKPLTEVFAIAGSYVQEMHEKSHLWAELRSGKGQDAWAAEAALLEFMGDYFKPDGTKPPMCGSSVHFDRSFLKYHLNTLESRFSYRNIDVSTIKELAHRWAPPIYMTRPGQNDEDKAHRALDDVLASIDELNHYVDSGFINPFIPTRQETA